MRNGESAASMIELRDLRDEDEAILFQWRSEPEVDRWMSDADLAKESARLQALQVKQQLGAQALSIANGAPQIILSLFRGG